MDAHVLLPLAVELSASTLATGQPTDDHVAAFFKTREGLDTEGRRFVAEMVYGVLRERIYLDALASRALRDTRFPAHLSEYAVFYFFSLSKLGVSRPLRRAFALASNLPAAPYEELTEFFLDHRDLDFLADAGARFSARHAFPEWATEDLRRALPLDEIAELYAFSNMRAPLCLRVNTLKTTRDALRERLASEGVVSRPGLLSPFCLVAEKRPGIFGLPSFKEGLFEVQDEGSQLVSILLNAKPTASVLDACAGAGGKTLHVAALMRGRGDVFAYDTDEGRRSRITARVRRSGAQNVRILDTPSKFERFAERRRGALDCVLVDAPCTGMGTVRRNPRIKLRTTEEFAREMSGLQSRILDTYAGFVRPGGRLLYATCSILPSENRDVAERFLAAHPEFELEPVDRLLASMNVPFDVSALRTLFAGRQFLEAYPHRHGTDGFFAASLRRR